MDAAATTASTDPGRLLEVGLLALASSVRPDSDAAATTAPSGLEDLDAAATTASDDPGRPFASVLLAPTSSVRPDSDAAATTAPSGLEDVDAAATTASNDPGLTAASDSRDLVKVVTSDRGLREGSLGRWDCELFR